MKHHLLSGLFLKLRELGMAQYLRILLSTGVVIGLTGTSSGLANSESLGRTTIITPSELVEKNPNSDNPVTVSGILENAGTNYFTDRRIVIRGAADGSNSQSVIVAPTPLTETPLSNRSGSERPPVLSDYLGKQVIIKGTYTNAFIKGVGDTKILRVEKIEPLESGQKSNGP